MKMQYRSWEYASPRDRLRPKSTKKKKKETQTGEEKKKLYIVQYIHIYKIYIWRTMSTYFLTRVAYLGYYYINYKILQLINICIIQYHKVSVHSYFSRGNEK